MRTAQLFPSRKTIEQTVATRSDQRGLAAATRVMGGIPVGEIVVAESGLGTSFGVACPVAAGHVVARRIGGAVQLGTGENVVAIRKVAATRNETAALIERIHKPKSIVDAMQRLDIRRDL